MITIPAIWGDGENKYKGVFYRRGQAVMYALREVGEMIIS